jgi:hypothetical protein
MWYDFSMTFSEKSIRTLIFILKGIYLSISVLLILLLLLTHELELINYFSVSMVIFYGLHKVKFWVIPIIIILNLIGALRLYYGLSEYPQSILVLARILLICLPILLILFLTKKEVKAYFRLSKSTLSR